MYGKTINMGKFRADRGGQKSCRTKLWADTHRGVSVRRSSRYIEYLLSSACAGPVMADASAMEALAEV